MNTTNRNVFGVLRWRILEWVMRRLIAVFGAYDVYDVATALAFWLAEPDEDAAIQRDLFN